MLSQTPGQDPSYSDNQVKLVVECSKLGILAADALSEQLELREAGQKWARIIGAFVGVVGGHKIGRTLVVLNNQSINAQHGHLRVLHR